MRQILENLYSKLLPVKEDFGHKKQMRVSVLPLILANITALVILLFLGKYLWNNYLTKLVTVVNPVESVFDLLALSILLNLLVGN